jgi:hypothetical protein
VGVERLHTSLIVGDISTFDTVAVDIPAGVGIRCVGKQHPEKYDQLDNNLANRSVVNAAAAPCSVIAVTERLWTAVTIPISIRRAKKCCLTVFAPIEERYSNRQPIGTSTNWLA